VKTAYERLSQRDLSLIAGSLSFSTVLSLIPLLAVSLSVFHWLGGFEDLLQDIEPFIFKNFVENSGVELSRYLSRSVHRIHSGALGVSGAFFLLLTSTKLFADMEMGIQRVWRLKKQRALWKRLAVYWAVMFIGPLILAVVLGVVGSRNLNLVQLITSEVIAAFFALFGLFAIFKWVPARKVDFQPAFLSALLAVAGLVLAQQFYASVMRGLFRVSNITAVWPVCLCF
jgi:membrane protein